VPHPELDAGGTSAETFEAQPFGPAALRSRLHDARLVSRLAAVPAVLHLTNHHLAGYGPRTRWPYLVTVHDLIRVTEAGSTRWPSPRTATPWPPPAPTARSVRREIGAPGSKA
jgi:hypothetical protein